MKVQIVTASTVDPITLDEAKNFLKIDTDDDDELLFAQIGAAREYVEGVQGRKLMNQTCRLYLEEWPEGEEIKIPFPPLSSVSSITYTDYNNSITSWSSSQWNYDTVSEPGRITLAYGQTWPTATLAPQNPICITFVCGYGTPDDVPEMTKNAIKLILDELYENREVVVTGQTVNRLDLVDRLIMMERVWWL